MTPLEWLKLAGEAGVLLFAAFKLANGVANVARELAEFRRVVEREMDGLRREMDGLRGEVRAGAMATQEVLGEHTDRIARLEGRLDK